MAPPAASDDLIVGSGPRHVQAMYRTTNMSARSPDMVRRYSATYRRAQAAARHAVFSPGDGMLLEARRAALSLSPLRALRCPQVESQCRAQQQS